MVPWLHPALPRRRARGRPVMLLGLMAIFGACYGGEQPSPAEAQGHSNPIRSLKAYAYLHARGEFGRDDLVPGKLALWNTPFGEGDISSPSGVTLVMVELERPSSELRFTMQLRLTAEANGQPLLKQDLRLGLFNGDSKTITIPFLIYGTGCETLALRAEILGGEALPERTLSAEVPFGCGE